MQWPHITNGAVSFLGTMVSLLQDIDKKQDAALADIDKHTKSLRHLRVRAEDIINLDMTHRVAMQRVRDLETVANSRTASKHLVEAKQELVALKKRFEKVQFQACYCCTTGEPSQCIACWLRSALLHPEHVVLPAD